MCDPTVSFHLRQRSTCRRVPRGAPGSAANVEPKDSDRRQREAIQALAPPPWLRARGRVLRRGRKRCRSHRHSWLRRHARATRRGSCALSPFAPSWRLRNPTLWLWPSVYVGKSRKAGANSIRPDRGQCRTCRTSLAGRRVVNEVAGLSAAIGADLLNHEITSEVARCIAANQLAVDQTRADPQMVNRLHDEREAAGPVIAARRAIRR
jgi:hypothetical protein